MIIGYTFDGQPYPAAPFAKMVEEAINYQEGIINGIELTNSKNLITISEGRILVKGRQFKVLESETVDVESAQSGELYCVLIVEIDLNKESTETNFKQVQFKVLSSALDYPSLTKQDINSEKEEEDTLYQYELARFKTTINGITDFQDMRTFLDFDSIYSAIKKEYRAILSNLKQELASVQDGSAYMLKDNIVVLRGRATLEANTSENASQEKMKQTRFFIDFPNGFTEDNTIVLAFGVKNIENRGFCYGDTSGSNTLSGVLHTGAIPKSIIAGEDNEGKRVLRCDVYNLSTQDINIQYRIVLMKIPDYVKDVDYILGDVNADGQITEEDSDMCLQYSTSKIVLTEKQFKAADVNKDGEVDSRDSLRILKHINEGYEFE